MTRSGVRFPSAPPNLMSSNCEAISVACRIFGTFPGQKWRFASLHPAMKFRDQAWIRLKFDKLIGP